jgi:hypothetical protein
VFKVSGLASLGGTLFTKTFSYDAFGRPTSVKETFGGESWTSSTVYGTDPANLITWGKALPFMFCMEQVAVFLHGAGTQLGRLTVSALSLAEMRYWGSHTLVQITGIPIRNPGAILQTGQKAWTCVTVCGSAYLRSWFK